MNIIKANIATINHNDADDQRVALSVAQDEATGEFFVVATDEDGDEQDTEVRFATAQEAEDSIWERWGKGNVWGLAYTESNE